MKTNQIEFKPMIVPTLKGIDNLDNIPDELFPLYYMPFFKGLPLYIKDGRIKVNGTNELVKNYELGKELKFLRDLTHKIGFVIHLTFQYKNFKGNKLYEEVLNEYGQLPKDYKLQFTDVVIKHPKSLVKMKLDPRDANMWFIENALKRENSIKPHWYFNRAYIAPTNKELYNYIEPRLIYDNDIAGVTLHKPKSSYHCGFANSEVDIINIDLLREEEFTIINLKCKVLPYGKKDNASIVSELVISKGTSIYILDVSTLDMPTRKLMWDKRSLLYNKPAIIEVLTIPSSTSPIFKRIIRLGAEIK